MKEKVKSIGLKSKLNSTKAKISPGLKTKSVNAVALIACPG
jgi:hypothetical protein